MEEEKNIRCLNCEESIESNQRYCPHCGQVNRANNLTFKYFVTEFLSANFNIDSKIFVSLKLLITSPAALSEAFLKGKRSQYITPLRLYLIISLLFFFVLSLVTINGDSFEDNPVKLNLDENLDSLVNTPLADSLPLVEMINELPIAETKKDLIVDTDQLDSLDVLTEVDSSGIFQETIVPQLKKLNTDSGKKDFYQLINEYASIGMFVLMPFAALLLYTMFSRRRFYIEHLILSLHLHTLAFLLFTVFNVLELFISWSYLGIIEFGILLVFIIFWLKSFYHLRWWVSILKSILFLILYDILLLLFFIVIAGISFINI